MSSSCGNFICTYHEKMRIYHIQINIHAYSFVKFEVKVKHKVKKWMSLKIMWKEKSSLLGSSSCPFLQNLAPSPTNISPKIYNFLQKDLALRKRWWLFLPPLSLLSYFLLLWLPLNLFLFHPTARDWNYGRYKDAAASLAWTCVLQFDIHYVPYCPIFLGHLSATLGYPFWVLTYQIFRRCNAQTLKKGVVDHLNAIFISIKTKSRAK